MATERVSMREFRKVLGLRNEAKLSYEKIAAASGLSLGAVSKYLTLAQRAGLGWPLPEGMDDVALEARLYPPKPKAVVYAEPDYRLLHQALKHKTVTLALLWEEYREANGLLAYQYSAFCDHYRAWHKKQDVVMRQSHKAGEKGFVDYSGVTVPVVDVRTGEEREAEIFVMVLGASSYTYAEASWTQSLPDWLASHWRAYQYFDGVPAAMVPDCLKSGVKKADRYEPKENETYQEMAEHCGTVVLPARPYKPRDKAKVEVGVQVVQRWILARLRTRTFFSLAELNAAIRVLLEELNRRPFRKMKEHSRRSLYEMLDKPALKPLPAKPYEMVERSSAKVFLDYHIKVAGNLYSVPYTLVGEKLDVRTSASLVEFFLKGRRVAAHARVLGKSREPITDRAHMPKSHREHLEWSPGRFLNWGWEIGPRTRDVVRHLLTDRPHPEHGYRACLGLLSLSKKYSRERLEAACAHAMALKAPNYQSVKNMLHSGFDQQALPQTKGEDDVTMSEHPNLRGPDYYQ
jgi:transposase